MVSKSKSDTMTEREAMDRVRKIAQRLSSQQGSPSNSLGDSQPSSQSASRETITDSYNGALLQAMQSPDKSNEETEIDEDQVAYEDRPDYIGQLYDNEPYLEVAFGQLSSFDWGKYLSLAEEIGIPDRIIKITCDGVEHNINANVWAFQEFITALPSVSTLHENDVWAFFIEDTYTEEQVTSHANSLHDALIRDCRSLSSAQT